MTPSAAPATTTSYALSESGAEAEAQGLVASLRRFLPLLATERRLVTVACGAVALSSLAGLLGPLLIARAVDTAMRQHDFPGVLRYAGILLVVYTASLGTTYVQTQAMGTVGRRVLFAIRNRLFTKLQELPLDFFNQNRAGDLISRINNDTDKLNVFFSQSLVQLAANLFLMAGAAIFLVSLHPRLGVTALVPAVAALLLTRATGPWVKRRNRAALQALGGLSAEIQESLGNFRVIVAFNRRDYFRRRFEEANARSFTASVASGLANGVFLPTYGLAYNIAQIIVLLYGVALIVAGEATVGLLIGFLLYVNSFYFPMRQLATIWTSFQQALAGLDRISEVLALQSNMPVLAGIEAPAAATPADGEIVLSFDGVSFAYPGGVPVLHDISFNLRRGRTYALVGPTGGGKSTTAALMARLYDPATGLVRLDGRDIRTVPPEDRASRIGFILQEPFLFTGTVRDNIVYGNDAFTGDSTGPLLERLHAHGLEELVARFEHGLDTLVSATGDGISLGQKQLIAFMRAVLRDPELLILDEATANVDTVTEQLLDQILAKLPPTTTRVIIAHRLNTIADADEIFFINAGTITPAGSMEHALDLLLHGRRQS